jgi:hypothetical protein
MTRMFVLAVAFVVGMVFSTAGALGQCPPPDKPGCEWRNNFDNFLSRELVKTRVSATSTGGCYKITGDPDQVECLPACWP